MSDQWTLHQAKDWIIGKCVERYRADPANPVFHIPFHQAPSPDAPPDGLVLRAFHILEEDGAVTGYVIDADNTGAIWIRNLQLSDQAVLRLEASANEETDEDRDPIGFLLD